MSDSVRIAPWFLAVVVYSLGVIVAISSLRWLRKRLDAVQRARRERARRGMPT